MVVLPISKKESVYDLWERIQNDPQYRAMLLELRKLEPKYDNLLSKLTPEEQDIICDYISACEEMSWRALEFACENLGFLEK